MNHKSTVLEKDCLQAAGAWYIITIITYYIELEQYCPHIKIVRFWLCQYLALIRATVDRNLELEDDVMTADWARWCFF